MKWKKIETEMNENDKNNINIDRNKYKVILALKNATKNYS